ncbi:MAG: mechanosensitive ion channel family protein [Halanaerobiaceae bacterium]
MDILHKISGFVLQQNFIYSILVLLLAGLTKWALNQFIVGKIQEKNARYRWKKTGNYIIFFATLLLLMLLWLKKFELGTFLGLSGAGLAIALRDLLTNLVGWIFIVWKRPFTIGDRIEINGTSGDVIDIRVFQFTILEIGNWVAAEQSTGRVVHIPNQSVFQNNLANYTADFPYIWNEIPILITFESDWEKARTILRSVAGEVVEKTAERAEDYLNRVSRRKYMVYYGKLTPIIYTSVKESGILLTLRYLSHPQSRRSTEDRIWRNVLDKFAASDDVEYAYQTHRVYFRQGEDHVVRHAETDEATNDGMPGEE